MFLKLAGIFGLVAHIALVQGNFNAVESPVENLAPRISGGTEATPGEFPWMAQLIMNKSGKEYLCGGSIISSDWILTAAHCLNGAQSVTVILGAHRLSANEPSRAIYYSAELHIHPNYIPNQFHDEIGLVKLKKSITFTSRILPLSLNDPSDSQHVNDIVTVTGWGYFSNVIDSTSDVLLKATTDVISNQQCQKVWPTTPITDSMLCSSGAGGKGTCVGDSGGPMVYRLPDGTWVQIGITNFGTDRKECELDIARGFTRVKSYLKWITSVTGIPHPFSCNWKTDGSYANPDDCTTFYMCSNEYGYLFNCPSSLVFNPNSKQCDYRFNVPQC